MAERRASRARTRNSRAQLRAQDSGEIRHTHLRCTQAIRGRTLPVKA